VIPVPQKPAPLRKGDRVAILSPSWGGPSVFPHVYEKGLDNLRLLGLEPVEFPTARMAAKELHRNPRARAEDINRAFGDPSIKGIIATIGGSDSVRILKYLDGDLIRGNRKFLMGYSDFTTLTAWLNQLGLVTFNGPSVMAGFSQWESFDEDYRKYVTDYLFSPEETGLLPRFPRYCDGYPSWADRENTGKLNPLKESESPRFLQGEGRVEGRLFGGCLEVLEIMKGTPFWPEESFWDGRILFFETSEDKPPVDYVRYWLRNYGVMGVFDRIAGILFGRARDYTGGEKTDLEETVLEVVRDEFGNSRIPIVCNLDFGHTDPQVILPLGITFRIDCGKGEISQRESAFARE